MKTDPLKRAGLFDFQGSGHLGVVEIRLIFLYADMLVVVVGVVDRDFAIFSEIQKEYKKTREPLNLTGYGGEAGI